MRSLLLVCLTSLFVVATPPSAAQEASRPAASDRLPDAGRVPDIFEDVMQLERVDAVTTREIVKRFQLENPVRREYALNLASQGYEEDDSNPALRLDKATVGPAGVLLEISGLARSRNAVSAVMRRDTLRLKSSKGETSSLLAFEGVTELRDRRGGSALVVNPGDKLYLPFDKLDDYFAITLSHTNRDGRESIYFPRIDPRFDERYETMFAAATTPLGMKDFVVEFARQDPKARVLPVFSRLLGQMRAQNTFEGYHAAYQLIGEPRDYAGMQRTAITAEHKAVIDAIEAEKLAEVRRREEARLAEVRRQEAQQLAAQRAEQARQAEQRCLATPACVREMEERRSACVQSIQNCRNQCDRLTGSGSFGSWISNLAAAGMSAVCSRACKCENNFGDLLAKFNNMASGNESTPSRSSAPAPKSATAKVADPQSAPAKAAEPTAPRPSTAAVVDHVCTVYCKGPEAKIQHSVKASSPTEAASLIDPQGHQICRAAGHERASDLRMAASQCRKR